MRYTTLMMVATVLGLAAAVPAQAQNGLLVPTTTTNWPQWQGRLALSLSPPTSNDSPRWRSGGLLGDYYFYRHTMSSPTAPRGGFRATSGLMFGSASPRLLAGLGAGVTSGYGLGLNRTGLGLRADGWSSDADHTTTSYLGMGYTLLSLRGGWGLSADIGLATIPRLNTALGPGSSVGRSGLEDNLRDSRLTPLLQLGLSYSF
jgi:hypothetical protein